MFKSFWILFVVLLAGQPLFAQRVFDDGAPASSDWNLPDNWQPDGVPGAGENAYIGSNWTAIITQTGMAANILFIGHTEPGQPGPGSLTISSGSLTVQAVRVGTRTNVIIRSPGTLTVSGGMLHVGTGGVFIAQDDDGSAGISSGTFNLTGGKLEIGGSSNVVGTFNLDGGVLVANNSDVEVGAVAGGQGTFNIGGGTLDLSGGDLNAASFAGSRGTFQVTGGTILHQGNMNLGKGAAGLGTFNIGGGTYGLSGGEINVGAGAAGYGTFQMDGGVFIHSGAGTLNVGKGVLSQGTLQISQGTYNMQNGVMNLGAISNASGFFDQQGGVFNLVTGQLNVGSAGGGVGYHTIYNGTFNILGGQVDVGSAAGGGGTFQINGGTLAQRDSDLNVGSAAAGNGTFQMAGGTYNIAGGQVNVGAVGGAKGTFNMSGGVVNQQGGGLDVGNISGGQGTVNIGGGTFNLSGGNVNVGSTAGGAGTFQINGGVLGVHSGDVGVATAAGGLGGTFNMSGGLLFLDDGAFLSGGPGASNAVVELNGATLDLNGSNVVLGGAAPVSNEFRFLSGVLGNVSHFYGDVEQRGGRLDLGPDTGTMVIHSNASTAGDYELYSPGTLRIKIDGTAGPGLSGGHDVLRVEGGIQLNADSGSGGALEAVVRTMLDAGDLGATFLILENLGAGPTLGAFAGGFVGPIQGSNGEQFSINYQFDAGADGASNDVQLVLTGVGTSAPPLYIPDAWKQTHFGSTYAYPGHNIDSDGDKQLNIEEFIANTIPVNSDSYFRVADISKSNLSVVTVMSETGRIYSLDSSPVIGSAWMNVESNQPGTGALLPINDTNGSVRAVYRFKVELEP